MSEEQPSAEPARPSGPTARTWIISAVVAVVVAAGAIVGITVASGGDDKVTTAAAAPNDTSGGRSDRRFGGGPFRRGDGVFGTIESIDGSTITVKDRQGGKTDVVTTDSTEVTSSDPAMAADLKVGDHVRAIGSGSATELTAERLTDSGDREIEGRFGGPGPFPGRFGGRGPRAGSAGGPATGGGTDRGTGDGQAPPVTDGRFGGGDGRPGEGGRFTPPTVVSGTIASVDGSKVTVTTDSGPATVTLTGTTQIDRVTSITLGDLKVGDQVSASAASVVRLSPNR